ncbi:hypothetical protein CBR_g19482 [Chara braunii]|uniref:Protein kinase domain-containing protein n=1 Tax=Chara braunii TaxID=69332 RepID=A0A388KY41_CHABU|nr:hypothetical protein CBR_g19482 [Chara braunii]|eukprot:GBG74969.1 hypothetical protein CBR_g19482 [Chara braunii]
MRNSIIILGIWVSFLLMARCCCLWGCCKWPWKGAQPAPERLRSAQGEGDERQTSPEAWGTSQPPPSSEGLPTSAVSELTSGSVTTNLLRKDEGRSRPPPSSDGLHTTTLSGSELTSASVTTNPLQKEEVRSQPPPSSDGLRTTTGTEPESEIATTDDVQSEVVHPQPSPPTFLPEPVQTEIVRTFSLLEIRAATNDFSQECRLVGKAGGFGEVYRVHMMIDGNSCEVAIKVMKGEMDNHNYNQFLAEVQMMSLVRHRNLIKLIGYCLEGATCALVYPFIAGGSLYDRLHGCNDSAPKVGSGEASAKGHLKGSLPKIHQKKSRLSSSSADSAATVPEPLTVMERLTIVKQVSTGLSYLHHQLDKPILHRDIKSRNLLVNGKGEELRAYLIDFGLARPVVETVADDGKDMVDEKLAFGTTILTLAVCGTPGYMAPEYAQGMKLTAKNDVYAFGIVLLELVTGRKAFTKAQDGHMITLSAWSQQWLAHRSLEYRQFGTMVDPVLVASNMSKAEWDALYKLAYLAHRCVSCIPHHRPSMEEIADEVRTIWRDTLQAMTPSTQPSVDSNWMY